jgi:hypothetical protein
MWTRRGVTASHTSKIMASNKAIRKRSLARKTARDSPIQLTNGN